MTIVKTIKKLSLKVLGCEAEPWEDVWTRVKDLADAFGAQEVADTFEEWAKTRQGEMLNRPVAEFLKFAPGLLKGITSLKPDPNLTSLVNDLVFITDGAVTFDREQQIEISRLLSEYTVPDIKAAFTEFFSQIDGDEFLVKRGAQNFVEKAPQLLELQKRRKEKAKEQAELLVRITDKERAAAETERAEKRRLEAEELASVEDTL